VLTSEAQTHAARMQSGQGIRGLRAVVVVVGLVDNDGALAIVFIGLLPALGGEILETPAFLGCHFSASFIGLCAGGVDLEPTKVVFAISIEPEHIEHIT